MVMDNKTGSFFGGLYSAGDSYSNVPVSSGVGLAQLSPYLNIDPSVLQAQPEFLTLEGASQKRGRFELAFSQIGGLCMTGASIGGAHGFYKGYLETKAAGNVGKIRRTQMLNYVMKRGTAMSNTLGVAAVMYSALGFLLYHVRKEEDSFNTVGASALTGLLYKSTAGLKPCLIGGGVGLVLSTLFVAISSRNKNKGEYLSYTCSTY